jgi:hypothetical protein
VLVAEWLGASPARASPCQPRPHCWTAETCDTSLPDIVSSGPRARCGGARAGFMSTGQHQLYKG